MAKMTYQILLSLETSQKIFKKKLPCTIIFKVIVQISLHYQNYSTLRKGFNKDEQVNFIFFMHKQDKLQLHDEYISGYIALLYGFF